MGSIWLVSLVRPNSGRSTVPANPESGPFAGVRSCGPLEDRDGRTGDGAARAVGYTDLAVRDVLAVMVVTVKQVRHLDNLARPTRPDQVSPGLEPAREVYREGAISAGRSITGGSDSLSRFDESQRLNGEGFGDSEAVVDLDGVNLVRGDVGLVVGLASGFLRCLGVDECSAILKRQTVAFLSGAGDRYGCIDAVGISEDSLTRMSALAPSVIGHAS